jgi:putative protease
VPVGWRVLRTSQAALLERARASFAALGGPLKQRKTRVDVRAFGSAGGPLKLLFAADGETVDVRSEIELAPAHKRALDRSQLREQLGRLGETPFALGTVDDVGLAPRLFLPVSELNTMRQRAVEQLLLRRDWAEHSRLSARREEVERLVSGLGEREAGSEQPLRTAHGARRIVSRSASGFPSPEFTLSADVYRLEDARAAAEAGATEIAFDPFLRHPVPALARLRALHAELAERGVTVRLRTPTIVRPEERRTVDRWLDLGLPLLSGHLGLVAELAGAGRDVVADYAVNCFNQHTAAELLRLGAARIVVSVELTVDELAGVVAPWHGRGFDVLAYGRPEGMTIEHCVLSAAFDRVPTTCRDLCVQKHPLVQITDPAGYTFPVATDSACRNRLLHSRPIEGSEYLPRLWRAGLRNFSLLFNIPGDPVAEIVARYHAALDALARGHTPPVEAIRSLVGTAFTRGHFARAV